MRWRPRPLQISLLVLPLCTFRDVHTDAEPRGAKLRCELACAAIEAKVKKAERTMKDLSQAEVARYQLEELLGNQRVELDRAIAANQRWVLSLAVANGAALTALAAKLVDSRSEYLAALVMPSCWMFAAGLVCAGLVSPLTAKRHSIAWTIWKTYTLSFRRGEALEEPSELKSQEDRLFRAETVLEWSAAALFFAGLMSPLASLGFRYLFSGQGFYPAG